MKIQFYDTVKYNVSKCKAVNNFRYHTQSYKQNSKKYQSSDKNERIRGSFDNSREPSDSLDIYTKFIDTEDNCHNKPNANNHYDNINKLM